MVCKSLSIIPSSSLSIVCSVYGVYGVYVVSVVCDQAVENLCVYSVNLQSNLAGLLGEAGVCVVHGVCLGNPLRSHGIWGGAGRSVSGWS